MPISEARRIGIVLHDFPAGGTERIAIRLAEAWSSTGRSVTIFCGTTAGPAFAALPGSVRRIVADPAIPRSPLSRLRLGRWVRAALAAHPVDVLVAPGNFHLPVLFAAGRLPCAVAAKLSNPLAADGRGGALLAGIERRLIARCVDRLVAMSPALTRGAKAIDPACAVLAEPILPAPPAICPQPPGPPVVLCAGRMVRQKRVSLALRAFAALGDEDATLVLLGDGPERATLEREAIALGIAGRTSFIGHVPDIAPWLARAHAFLLTSRYEGYPAVLVEAIGAGVPVVTTNSSDAIAEFVDAPARGRVAAADPAALARALRKVLAGMRVDEASRQGLVARHLAGPAAARWLEMLDRLVASRSA